MGKLDIEVVKSTLDATLPNCWLPLEAVLSTVGAAMLKDVDHCVGLILVGQPGGRKSTTLELLGSDEPFLRIYTFTPASFVSHDATKKPAQLAKIDLLPQVTYKIMIIPEMAPLFGQRQEDLLADIATLTAVMDGKGYKRHTAVHGLRGYEGDYRFSMIAATTPLEHRAWQALGRLSSRWIFYTLEPASTALKDLSEDFGTNKRLCQLYVQGFLSGFWQGYAEVRWNRKGDDPNLLQQLAQSAVIISHWRGLVPKQDHHGYNPPVIEAPDRLRETLYALARGHALVYGRQQLTQADVDFIVYLNETNMPEDRLRIFRLFGQGPEALKKSIIQADVARALGCSKDKADRVLSQLVDLGVLSRDELLQYSRVV